MAEQDKITLALREIGHCPELKVAVADGVIVKILKQRIFREQRNGIKIEIVIDEEIRR